MLRVDYQIAARLRLSVHMRADGEQLTRNMSLFQFIGAPCGSHGPYTFYKAVKFQRDGKVNILKLGEFFFLKILEDFPLCIGEIQLLWEEKGTNQLLTSVRLYFQPQDAPGGPHEDFSFGDVSILFFF